MSMKPVKSEMSVIRHYLQQAIFHHDIGRIQYGADVADHFINTVPEKDRHTTKATGRGKTKLDFNIVLPSDDVEAMAKKRELNGRKVLAYVDGEAHAQLILRRSLIACLPELYRKECMRQLFRDEGYMCVPILCGSALEAGEVHKEYADVARSGGMLRANDGEINHDDPIDRLQAHRKELHDLQESVAAELAVVDDAIERKIKIHRVK